MKSKEAVKTAKKYSAQDILDMSVEKREKDMAADLDMTEALADIGVDELSVAVPYLLGVRRKVCEC